MIARVLRCINKTGWLPAAPAAQHNPQQQPHTQTARMACCRAGPALSTQPQQRAHERRVSGVSIRLGMRAAPAVRQWPAGRLVKAPQQPLQAVGRRGGGGVCVRGKRGGCERSTHYLREQSVSHYLREQSTHYLRRPLCGGSWRDTWRRRGSNRSGRRGGAGVWGGAARGGGAQRMREKRRLQRLAPNSLARPPGADSSCTASAPWPQETTVPL